MSSIFHSFQVTRLQSVRVVCTMEALGVEEQVGSFGYSTNLLLSKVKVRVKHMCMHASVCTGIICVRWYVYACLLFITLCACAARGRVIGLSVSQLQSVCLSVQAV